MMRGGWPRGAEERTAFWAAGLFCAAVPITHNACTFMSSDGEASRPCSGSHMPSLSRSDRKNDARGRVRRLTTITMTRVTAPFALSMFSTSCRGTSDRTMSRADSRRSVSARRTVRGSGGEAACTAPSRDHLAQSVAQSR